MSKKIIAETDIKPDYSQYLYVCKRNPESGNLDILQIEKQSNRGKKYKK